MRKNILTIKRILEEIDKRNGPGKGTGLIIDGRSEEEVQYHVKLMLDDKLIECYAYNKMFGYSPTILTGSGNDLLTALENKTVFDNVTKYIKEKGGEIAFTLIKTFVISEFKRLTGIK